MKTTKKAEAKTTVKPVERTSKGLRDAIFDEMDAVRNNSSNPTRANAVAKLATGIVETVRMEIEVQRHAQLFLSKPRTKAADVLGLGVALPLGSE